MQQRGKIIRYIDDRGFGFIKPDDGGPDVFMHISGVAPGYAIEVGASVVFDVEFNQGSGKPRATGVRTG
jgi:cold shock protein